MDSRILIISDSHGDARLIDEVIERESPFDILVHCGDMEGSLYYLEKRENPFRICAVRGNCDGYGYPQDVCFKTGVYNIFVSHGHKYDVHSTTDGIFRAGKKHFADVILFGHTHVPMVAEKRGILLVNPGSIALPKQASHRRSYAILTISDDCLPDAEICYLDDITKDRTPMVLYNIKDPDRLIKAVMHETDRGMTTAEIAEKHGIPAALSEKICRMYLTHPGITVDGILERINK